MIKLTRKDGGVDWLKFETIADMMVHGPCIRWGLVQKIEEESAGEGSCDHGKGASRIAPIEIHRYDPDPNNPPFLKYAGTRPVGEVYRELEQRLEAEGLLPDEYFDLVYPDLIKKDPSAPFPEYRRLACYAVTGDSEGYYVHVDAIIADRNVYPPSVRLVPVFLGKTFQGMDFAYRAAAACARHLGA